MLVKLEGVKLGSHRVACRQREREKERKKARLTEKILGKGILTGPVLFLSEKNANRCPMSHTFSHGDCRFGTNYLSIGNRLQFCRSLTDNKVIRKILYNIILTLSRALFDNTVTSTNSTRLLSIVARIVFEP